MGSTFRILAAALIAGLSGCGGSAPPDAGAPPAEGPLPPVMRCAPEPGAATVAKGECGVDETERRA